MNVLARVGSSLLLSFFALACASEPLPEPQSPGEPTQSTAPPSSAALGARASGEPGTVLPVELDDIQLGDPQAEVTLIAFLNFECSSCLSSFRTLQQLRATHEQSELRIVLKHLPESVHTAAFPAAIATQAVQLGLGSEAAFRYAQKIFEHPASIGYTELAQWAQELGLSRDMYNESVSDELTVQRIASDVMQARRLGLEAPPAFFLNGRLFTHDQEVDTLRAAIQEERRAMQQLLQKEEWATAYQKRILINSQESVVHALLARDPHDYRVPLEGSPTLGSAQAPVTVVLFTDFECPYCKRVEATLHSLKKKYSPEQVRWVFKHRPLDFHPRARLASLLTASIYEKKGSEAFFAAADDVFVSAPDLSDATLLAIGKKHGLTQDEAKRALAGQDPAANARLKQDRELALLTQAEGTPHFFINGKRLSGARPAAHFEALIRHELGRAEALLAQGVSPERLYETLQKDALSPGAPQLITTPLPEDNQPVRGTAQAPVSIHIWSDFECPYCKRVESVLAELTRRHPQKLRFIWHDLPLDFHEAARPAARAGREAFRQQGSAGFWKMHQLLFGEEGQASELDREALLRYGRKLGLQMNAYEKALDSEEHDAAIDADIQLASSLGLRGTPAFVVGGYLLKGAQPIEEFERLIEIALEK